MSSLQALAGDNWLNPMVLKVKEELNSLQTNLDKHVIFVWIPSHVGIKGNEKADVAAKAALDLPVSDMKIPHSDFKCLINPHIKKKWQTEWDAKIENKLHPIQPTLGVWAHAYRQSRHEELILARLRIGHSYVTNAYLLKNEDQPECVPCQSPLIIKHILIECTDFDLVRDTFYTVPDMKTLFDTVPPDRIISFIKEIGLYYKI
jgi:hypothetical protein